jgi:L-ribulokinase
MATQYTIGLDYGTNSVRALIVNVANGAEVAAAVWIYEHGTQGVILSRDPNLARQHPGDYLKGAEVTIKQALATAKKTVKGFKPEQVIGIGVDTTGSTPLPVGKDGQPLVFQKKFANHLAAMAWLWKDHTGIAEAGEITALARKMRPQYLAKCGGTYSSEWFFTKVLKCLRAAPEVFNAAHSWIELSDLVPAALTDTLHPDKFIAGICAAGHKAMYSATWGGYPDKAFLSKLDPKLGALRDRLPKRVLAVDSAVGTLTADWAKRTGLSAGIPVTVGAFDAHTGAIGAGVKPGTLVKIIGTSTCDIAISPSRSGTGVPPVQCDTQTSTKPHSRSSVQLDRRDACPTTLADIPGVCGIVDGSVVPGYFGIEAGQSAVGDIFNWLVNYIQPGGKLDGTHDELTKGALKLQPGESGLLALDWNNGNRTILVDQQLTGLMVGQTLYTTPAEIYRALIEATAYGALTIINRYEEYGCKISEVVNCGGIADKSALTMQIYADITGRPMKISRSAQTCALGSAIAAAVVAGAHKDFATAQKKMTGLKPTVYKPNPKAHAVYKELYALYKQLHDAFGTKQWNGNLYGVMKKLIEIRDKARK